MEPENKNQMSAEAISKVSEHVVKTKPLVSLADLLGLSEGMRDSFQERVTALTKTTAEVMVREIAPIWARVSNDSQDIHLDKEAALKSEIAKFTDTPIHGTREAAHGDFYASKILEEINLFSSRPFIYTGKIVKFKDVLYPNEALLWNISRATKSEEGLELSIVGSTEKGKVVVEIPTLKLGFNREELGKEELYSHYFNFFKVSSKTFTPEILKEYDFCLGFGESNRVPMALAESLVPAALLELSLERTGKSSGVYRSVEFKYYHDPTLGDFKTSIENLTAPKGNPGKFMYNFGVLCGQKDKLILSAKIKCSSSGKLD